MIEKQPFEVGEKVRPHFNFRKYYADVETCEVESCERGFCQSGWLVKVKEFNNSEHYGAQVFDSQWFFKIKS